MSYEKITKEATEAVKDFVSKAANGKDINGFNKAINSIGNNFFGALEYGNRVLKHGEGFGEAFESTFKTMAADGTKKLNMGKIAGSYIGVAAAGRVLGGGGLYKDKNGNTDIIGVPFL